MKYISQKLTKHLLKPLLIMKNKYKTNKIITNKKDLKVSQQDFHKVLTEIFNENSLTKLTLWMQNYFIFCNKCLFSDLRGFR